MNKEIDIQAVLNHTFESDIGFVTMREYLVELSRQCWLVEEGFSGKRPFNEGGWKTGIYQALADGKFISRKTSTKKADNIILACYDTLAYGNLTEVTDGHI